MKLLFSVHLFPPKRMSGSEIYILRLIKYLQSIGHQCKVLLHPYKNDYPMDKVMSYDGIQIFPISLSGVIEECILWADQIVTHLTATGWTISIANVYRKPVYHIVHAHDNFESVVRNKNVRVIYNCQTMKNEKNYPNDSFVLHPIIPFPTTKSDGECIAMVNMNENKGAKIFYEVASVLKDHRFLAIKGTYGEQIESDLPNVQIVEPTEYIFDVLIEAKLLLVPSEKEAWSMTASEAMAMNIPVIATGLPGLIENCGAAGTYVMKRNPECFINAINKLMNSKIDYIRARQAAMMRSTEQWHQSSNELINFDKWLHST